MKITSCYIEGHKALFFCYEVCDIELAYSLLCEVRQCLIASFESMINKRYPQGVEVLVIKNRPYLITVAKKKI